MDAQVLCSFLMVSMTATIVTSQCDNSQATEGFFFSCQIDGSNYFIGNLDLATGLDIGQCMYI